MRAHTSMNSSLGFGNFLQSTFSDISSNILTSETKCNAFIDFYKYLSLEQKAVFLCELGRSYGIDKSNIVVCANNIVTSEGKGEAYFYSASERMRSVLRPRYKTLFTHIGRVNNGVKCLVDLRADVLTLKQSTSNEVDGALYQELNTALRELLMMWFTVGFLNLERITWNSPCDLVQKVSNYEAVHKIKTLDDMRRRVGPYRRCYIFTHNSMPKEPVVVLHTALCNEISSSIHSIIQNARFRDSFDGDNKFDYSVNASSTASSPVTPTSPGTASFLSPISVEEERENIALISSAIFYSITSTQKGLQGIDMGNYLIKAVVCKLQAEFPHIQQFSSLSPIPGFRDWLLTIINHHINMRNAGEQPESQILLPHEISALQPYKLSGHVSILDTFKNQVLTHEWYRNQGLQQVMMEPLVRLCANYLYVQKRRNFALNPVANFHLSNGAELWRINFLADTSHRGLNQSCSLMVNYRYFLERTASNSQNYLENQVIPVSQQVIDILKDPSRQNVS